MLIPISKFQYARQGYSRSFPVPPDCGGYVRRYALAVFVNVAGLILRFEIPSSANGLQKKLCAVGAFEIDCVFRLEGGSALIFVPASLR